MGFGFPNNNLYRTLASVPATLNGTTVIATNNVLVTASRRDPWIRAASTNGSVSTAMTPAFIRAAAVVTFDFYLCNGLDVVPGAEVEIIVPTAMSSSASTISGGVGTLLADVGYTNIAADTRVGRYIRIKANTAGRVTGTLTLSDLTDRLILVNFLHIKTSLTTTVVAT